MSLSRSDFGEFFAALHDGCRPFLWQERLLDQVLTGRWPDLVVAPTGAGKTAVIDVHVFAQALTADIVAGRPPRRLAMVVDRRVLVDDQFEYARTLAGTLSTRTQESGVVGAVAQALWRLHPDRDGLGRRDVSPLVLGRLRGGQPPSRDWRDHPSAAAVICATPDMWGSRLLFRGYGSSRLAWPREAGLLAVDSAVVVDEAHLARQLLCTARRVAGLVDIAQGDRPGQPLQVVETTATPPPGPPRPRPVPATATAAPAGLIAVGVDEADLVDPVLAARLTRPKPVTLLPVPDWDATPRARQLKVAERFADAVSDLLPAADALTAQTGHDQTGHAQTGHGRTARTVGCLVNTVTRAIDVAAALRSRTRAGVPLKVVLICGQARPHDLDRLREAHPGLLTPGGNDAVDVLVSTQSLEVGVDLDLSALVTELAPGSALAQRAGRVNRRGRRPAGPVTVVIPEGGVTERTRSWPYTGEELAAALDWLHLLSPQTEGMSPWALRAQVPPPAPQRRVLHQRPELADVWHWARTSDDLAADPELDLWLNEDFEAGTSIGIAVREAIPVDASDAVELVKDLPPRTHEIFPVPYRTALSALGRLRAPLASSGDHPPATIRVRGEDVAVLTWRQDGDGNPGEPRLRPGDIVVLDTRWEIFSSPAAGKDGGFTPQVALPAAGDDAGTGDRFTAGDVLMAAPPSEGRVVLRLEPGVAGVTTETFTLLTKSLTESGDDDAPGDRPDEAARAEAIATWLQHNPLPRHPQMAGEAVRLLRGPRRGIEVIVRPSTGQITRVLLVDRRRAGTDEGLRQICTPATGHVTLHAHQQAVGERAGWIAASLGLSAPTVETIRQAGLHHDDGKQDPRFQTRLGHDAGPLLAKSASGTTWWQARAQERACGLPAHWRHEQRSVADYWTTISARDTGAHDITSEQGPRLVSDPELVARMVGTSHGYGRSGFPHTSTELLTTTEAPRLRAAAGDLFDTGRWDDLIETTHLRYGVWGCAYLEALLRAADGQISQEGR